MPKQKVEWITAEEAAEMLGYESMSGFYSAAKEQRRLAPKGENVLRWRNIGSEDRPKYQFDKTFVELYRDRRQCQYNTSLQRN